MSRIYAIEEDTGRRFLARITCDACERSVRPSPESAGWTKRGQDNGPGTDKLEREYCPDCS